MLRTILPLVAFLLLGAGSAHALVQRAYVSALTGNDANAASDCQLAAPCRWFGGAIGVVASGGEIVVLDSGAYGTVTITKSIAIVSPEGVYAGITVFAGDGIIIATAGVDVTLKGLTINGLGGVKGINMSAGNSLTVQGCTVTNFSTHGLSVTAPVKLRVLDSLFQGNLYGAHLSAGPMALVSNSRFIGNAAGLYARASGAGVRTRVDINRSEASLNLSGPGFGGDSDSSGRVELNVTDSVTTRNTTGIQLIAVDGTAWGNVTRSLASGNSAFGIWAQGAGAKIVARDNTITANDTGLFQGSSAVLQSNGRNAVHENLTAGSSGSITWFTEM